MRTQSLTQAEIRANLRSIEAVPRAVLPNGPARDALLMLLCHVGHEVYAYASGGPTIGTWCVWWQHLADTRSDHDGRLTIAQWCEQWRDLMAQAGVVAPGRTGGAV